MRHECTEFLRCVALFVQPLAQMCTQQLMSAAFLLSKRHHLHQAAVHDERRQAFGVVHIILAVFARPCLRLRPGRPGTLLFQSLIAHCVSPSHTLATTKPRPVVASPPICSGRLLRIVVTCCMTASASSSSPPLRVWLAISGAIRMDSGGRFSV